MNQQEKKYAVQRIYNTIIEKCREVVKSDETSMDHVKEQLEFNSATIHDYITSGFIKLHKKCNLPSKYAHKLSNLYDMSSIERMKNAAIKKAGLTKSKYSGYTSTVITISDPMHSKQARNFSLCIAKNIAKIKTAKKHLQNACDAIVLGTQSEALAAIKRIEDLKL